MCKCVFVWGQTLCTYRKWGLLSDFHHCKGHCRVHLWTQTSPWQRSGTPVLLLVTLTFVDNERTTGLINTDGGWVSDVSRQVNDPPSCKIPQKNCCHLCCRIRIAERREKVSVITEPVKSFGAPPAAAWHSSLIQLRLKVWSPWTPGENNPHMVIYDHRSSPIPWSALMNKTLLLLFSLLFSPCFSWHYERFFVAKRV